MLNARSAIFILTLKKNSQHDGLLCLFRIKAGSVPTIRLTHGRPCESWALAVDGGVLDAPLREPVEVDHERRGYDGPEFQRRVGEVVPTAQHVRVEEDSEEEEAHSEENVGPQVWEAVTCERAETRRRGRVSRACSSYGRKRLFSRKGREAIARAQARTSARRKALTRVLVRTKRQNGGGDFEREHGASRDLPPTHRIDLHFVLCISVVSSPIRTFGQFQTTRAVRGFPEYSPSSSPDTVSTTLKTPDVESSIDTVVETLRRAGRPYASVVTKKAT